MKRVFFSMLMVVFTAITFAQEVENNGSTPALVSKKGESFLPESGDWAISFDASPIFTYVGNAFNGSTNNYAPGVSWLNTNQTIVGKYFLDDKTAIRAILRIGFANSKTKASISDATVTTAPAYPATFPQVEDLLTSKSSFIGIGGGYEMRRGKTRLQGYYGGDAMLWISSSSYNYTYGNKISATVSVNGNSTEFGDATYDNLRQDAFGYNGRVIKEKFGTTFGFGVRGFIGAEYFIFPKIAIGAEYGWGVGIQKSGKGEQEIESYNGTNVGKVNTETPGSSQFGVDTDLNQGGGFGLKGSNTGDFTLRLTLHF
jgi:hypothetical protein